MALQKGDIDVAVNIAYGDMPLFRDKKGYHVSEIASIRDCLARMNVNEGQAFSRSACKTSSVICTGPPYLLQEFAA